MKEGYKVTELGEIPEDWEIVRQGDVATFYNGRAYKLSEWEQIGTPVVRLQNLTGSGTQYYYSNLILPNSQYCHFGDLLYMWSATFGPVWWKGEKAIYHYHIWKIEVNHNMFNKVFHYYLLDDITVQMKSQSHGSTMLHVTKGGMESFKILLPPLPEQQKIATILSTVDEKIENINVQISQTQELKKGLMQLLFSKGIEQTKFKSSELGEIPESWEIKTIKEFIVNFKGGASLTPLDFTNEPGFPVIPKKAITIGGKLKIDHIKPTYCHDSFAKQNIENIVDNDYIITSLRDLVPSGPNIGYMVAYNTPLKYILAQGVYGFTINKSLDKNFLIQYSNTQVFRDTMQKIMVGSTQVHIRNKEYFNVEIPFPPLPEQQKIASILSTIDEKIISLKTKKQIQQQLKKGLMQQLLTGKIRVKTSQSEPTLA